MIGKENVIIYGLGKCWEQYSDKLMKDYNILYCSDRNEKMSDKGKGIPYISPVQIKDMDYDKLILCNYLLGMKEELMLKYGIGLQKMVYCLEIYENIRIYPEKTLANNKDKLTIIIPTYNRKERLSRTLDLLQLQTNQNFNVIILDDYSNYDVAVITENRSKEFKERIKIVRNVGNLGLAGNTAFAFIQEAEGWIWTLADDDVPSVYAVEMIHQEIESADDIGIILFSINLMQKYMQDSYIDFENISDMTTFYQGILTEENCRRIEGDFIYFSNKVYHIRKITRCIKETFTYLYTTIPQNILLLSMLDKGEGSLRISDKKIVGYSSPDGDHWDWLDNGLGMTILDDLPLNISEEERSVIYKLCMFDYKDVIQAAQNDGSKEAINKIKKMYYRLYQYYLAESDKQVYINAWKDMERKGK